MELPGFKRGVYTTSILDLPARNVLIFSIAFITFICTSILFIYARYIYTKYLDSMRDVNNLPFMDPNFTQRWNSIQNPPEWVVYIGNDAGVLTIILIVVVAIISLVQFEKLRKCVQTDLCLLRLLKNIDTRLGILFSGEPNKYLHDSPPRFKDGWYLDIAPSYPLFRFGLNFSMLAPESKEWEIWHERGRLLLSNSWNDLAVPRREMAYFSFLKAKDEYMKTECLENESYPGQYEFWLDGIDSAINFTEPV